MTSVMQTGHNATEGCCKKQTKEIFFTTLRRMTGGKWSSEERNVVKIFMKQDFLQRRMKSGCKI